MRAIPLPVPEGLTCEFQPDRMVIRESWRKGWSVVGCFFCTLALAWLASSGLDFYAGTAWATSLVCGGLALFTVYGGLALWFNSTDLELTPDLLRVTTRPVPVHREIRVAPAGIRNVIYRETAEQGYATTYDVVAVTDDGETRLIRGKRNYEQVLFYVNQLRSALALPEGPLSPAD